MSRPALVLLDRDGTINVKAPEGEYVTAPEELELLPGAAEAVGRLNRAGVPVALVTNQRGIARGRMDLEDLEAVHAELAVKLRASADAHLDRIYACPHERDRCRCRKPEPGMVLDALRDFSVAAEHAVVVGDAESDAEAGRRAGTQVIRIGTDGSLPDLAAAVERLLAP